MASLWPNDGQLVANDGSMVESLTIVNSCVAEIELVVVAFKQFELNWP